MTKPNLVLITSKASVRTRVQQFIDAKRKRHAEERRIGKINPNEKIDIELVREYMHDICCVFDAIPVNVAMTWNEADKFYWGLRTLKELIDGMDHSKMYK